MEKLEPTIADLDAIPEETPQKKTSPKFAQDKTRALYQRLPYDAAGQIVLALLAATVLSLTVPHAAWWWVGAVSVVQTVRLVLFFVHQRHRDTDQRLWLWVYTLGSLLSGATWGALALTSFAITDASQQAVVLLLLSAALALVACTYVPRFSPFLTFVAAAVLPWLAKHSYLSGSLPGALTQLVRGEGIDQFSLTMFIGFVAILVSMFVFFRQFGLRSLRLASQHSGLSTDHAQLLMRLDELSSELQTTRASETPSAQFDEAREQREQPMPRTEPTSERVAPRLHPSNDEENPAAPISANTQQVLSSIDNVLAFNQLRDNTMVLEPRSFALRDLLQEALAPIAALAHERALAFRCSLASGVPASVHGDAARIRQIIVNLALNAVKFTERGEVHVVVSKQDAEDKGSFTLQVNVNDTGPGMSSEELERIFAPYVQGNASADGFPGVGLGLTVARRLAQRMGGDVSAVSKPGSGSRFSMSLPLQPGSSDVRYLPRGAEELHWDGSASSAVPSEAKLSGSRTEAAARSLRPQQELRDGQFILLVEDHPDSQMLAMHTLKKEGYRVTVANNGLEALEAMSQARFDLVLMDIEMPEMDGLEATRRIRAHEARTGEHTPIVAVTAFVTSENREACRAAGMDGFVPKPISRQSLMQAIQQHLAA